MSRVRRISPFDAPIIDGLPQLSKKGALRPICRVPKECLLRGNKDYLEHKSQLSGTEEIREFWKRVLASCPGSHTYGIAGGDREPLRIMSSDGAAFLIQYDLCPTQLTGNSWILLADFQLHCHCVGIPSNVKLFYYFYQFRRSDVGRPWHFSRATGALVIFKGIESKLWGWEESFVRIVPLRGTHPFWLDKQGRPLFPLIWSDSEKLPSTKDEDVTPMELEIIRTISQRVEHVKYLSGGFACAFS
ncbi:hypothetical protein G2W53_040104 [Senna tora]|uniref:Uncharacterized protein n=1 Tax=Senna tora TaxID=362788 RepID=A0A834SRM6_9FABA|nr:hypothetical protein G2W53_040104 [Senna tora]